MKKGIWLLVFLLAPVMAQERLAIEDFQVPATLSVSGTELSTRLKQIAEQYSTKYQIVISEGTIKEIRERIKTEYQLGVKPDINPDLTGVVEADKILKTHLLTQQRQLTLLAILLDKKSFSQEAVYQVDIAGRAVTDAALCSFWQKIEPSVNFATGLCAPKTWECDERRGDTCPVTLENRSVCTEPSKFGLPFETGHCTFSVFTQGFLGEYVLMPNNRTTVNSGKACLVLGEPLSRQAIQVKIKCEKS
jgi:hypothetical protein